MAEKRSGSSEKPSRQSGGEDSGRVHNGYIPATSERAPEPPPKKP